MGSSSPIFGVNIPKSIGNHHLGWVLFLGVIPKNPLVCHKEEIKNQKSDSFRMGLEPAIHPIGSGAVWILRIESSYSFHQNWMGPYQRTPN